MSDKSFDPTANSPRKRPRRWRGPRIAFAVLALGFAAFVLYFGPTWFPLIFKDDAQAIRVERAERRGRFEMGLQMPGQPDLSRLEARLASKGLAEGAPILVRIFKREFELEIWMKRGPTFQHFVTYPICVWSGALGPKLREGDGQSPEGFYSVDARALNPNSRYFRSFNVGYPNAFDAAHGRTGSFIMVHGNCASVGCFAMTDPQMGEIWRLVTAALKGTQKRFQVQIFPFRMTDAALDGYRTHPDYDFWRTLKAGYDLFEAERLPPRVFVCNGRYTFTPAGNAPNGDGGVDSSCPNTQANG